MNDLDDMDDWTKLSAFHDNELPPELHAEVAARLRDEPQLRAMLDEISGMSSQLASMRPVLTTQDDVVVPMRRRWLRKPLAFAAAFAAAAVFAGALFINQTPPDDMVWHKNFLKQDYTIGAGDRTTDVAATGFVRLPDLGAAGLTLVDMRPRPQGGEAYHFAGQNSCRLTVIVGPQIDIAADEGSTIRRWRAGDLDYVAMASRMDGNRFESITDYLEKLTAHRATEQDVMAMRAANTSAARCV